MVTSGSWLSGRVETHRDDAVLARIRVDRGGYVMLLRGDCPRGQLPGHGARVTFQLSPWGGAVRRLTVLHA